MCAVLSHEQQGSEVEFVYEENGAAVVRADLLYTTNGGDKSEEWFRAPASLTAGNKVAAVLPEGTTHYVINLIDENQFLVSYPDFPGQNEIANDKSRYSAAALKVTP